MKAVITPRIVGNRIDLNEALPIETPLSVSIDPSSACNFKCCFCYHSGHKKVVPQIMDYELYKKCIDDFKQFSDIVKTVRLYKEGEPLLNKRIVDMVDYAKKSSKVGRVDFTTNGVFLDETTGKQLASKGIDRIIVSLEGLTDDKYEQVTGTKTSFRTVYNNIKTFYKNRKDCILHVKTTDVCVSPDEEEEFFGLFGDICDEIFIEKVSPFWPEFDISNVKNNFSQNTHGETIKNIEVCPIIFTAMVVNSDGSVDICFADWQRKVILGNVSEESLYSIWHGEKINSIRMMHLKKGRKSHGFCSKCDCPDFTSVDNLDGCRDVIIERFEKRYK